MSTLSRSESRRLYSWWWDSHISPKNSKWLQENLTDMDAKVKSMIKLIEEDADSFARRAEMYYKKRPELMKLVEEFYRAYRALAERYDHATVELRHAHRTMAEAFPNQVFSSSGCEGGPQTPEMQHPVRALVDPDDFHKDALRLSSANRHTINDDGEYSDESNTGTRKGGLKIEGKLGKGIIPQKTAVCEIEKWDETEVQSLRKTLAEIQAEKDTAFLQYEQSLQKLSSLESKLEDVEGLNEQASRAEIEIKILKETLVKLEAERDAALIQYDKCLERISDLENTIFRTQENAKGLDERATKAEIEAQNLKRILSELESEKETFFLQYHQCLEMVSVLESKIFLAEEKAKALNEQTERAENEIYLLKQALHKLHDEKEAAGLRYEKCMERLTTMENEVSHAQEDVTRLNSEILTGLANLKTAEKQCSLLERSNFSLRLEANDLVQEIAVKDQELSKKENELEKLQSSLKDEHSRYVQVEVTLQALQNVHSRCQEEQKCLAIELQNRLQMLQELEARNHDLWEDVELSKEEKRSLKEMNSSSIISITSMQKEILSLKEMKEKLENEAELRAAQCDSLQQEICHLNKDINDLNRRYQALMEQVNLIGLNPDCLASSIKDLQDDNLKLREVCKNEEEEKEVLIEKNVTLERSLSQVRGELEGSREKVKELQDSCQFLQGEKSSLIAEKSILLSQLQTTTENMQKLLEKNAVLENSLSSARFELECLRIKSKGLEELCEILKSDKSYLQGERSGLIAQLENVEQRLGNLESMLTRLEEKYADLDKEKQSSLCQVKEIWGYLGGEKHDHTDYIHLSESRLSDLENRIHLLQQDRRLSKKEFEEALDNAVNSQVEIIILQNFMHDLEEKKLSLLIECQKQVEGSKLSNKLISELEIKNLEQLVEIECLLDEIENLRMGLHQVFMALQFDLVDDRKHGTEEEWITPSTILGNIEDIKTLHMKNLDEKHQLVVENLVLSTLLGQLGSEGAEMESEKKMLLQEVLTITDHCNFLQKDKHELLEINRQFGLGVNNSKKREEVLKAQLESQHVDMLCLQGSYVALEEESLKALEENRSLVQNYLDLQGELHILEIENHSILQKAEALDSLSLVLESFGTEKVEELKVHLEDINCLLMINSDLEKKIEMLGEKVDGQEVESQHLNETMEKLQQEVHEGKDLACQLHCQILIGNIFLRQKVMEFLEAEERLRAMYNMKAELMTINKALKRECEESKITQENLEKMVLELSKDCVNQKKVISRLNEANENLESEVGLLCNEVEERRTREESLTLELQEKSNEFGLWEAEASSFYFDLQMTSIREVLLENKVHELTAVCKSLKDENVAKDIEMEWMKERFHFLENEVRRFKAQLSAYVPTIAALRDDIESLEHNALHRRKHFAGTNKASMGREIMIQSDEMTYQELISDGSTLVVDGISDLMRMQTTIKAIEKALMEKTKRLQMQETLNMKQEAPSEGIERWRLRHSLNGENDNELAGSAKLHKHKSEISEVRHGTSMKDIPLDQASDSSLYKISKRRSAVAGSHRLKDAKLKSLDPSLELQFGREVSIDKREIPSNTIRDPNLEGANILERLASDAQKLMSLQTSVQVLKNEMEAKKRNKRAGVEYERLKRQLQEDEKMVAELIDTYDQLTKDIEGCPLSLEGNISVGSEEDGNDHGKRVTESAQKWFEKFGRLQLEVQSIQRVILKPDNEKKNKGNHKFPGRILLRDFIYRGRRNGGSKIRKKSRFCGCARPSTNEA